MILLLYVLSIIIIIIISIHRNRFYVAYVYNAYNFFSWSCLFFVDEH